MSIFYIPKNQETGTMWDTWLYWHEGSYTLYYLAKSECSSWDNISLAISPDGLQWNETGPILKMGEGVTRFDRWWRAGFHPQPEEVAVISQATAYIRA